MATVPTLLLLLLLCFIFSPSAAQDCFSTTFSKNRTFTTCNTLPYLSATIHWTYHPSNSTVDLAYRAPPPSASGWVAWALNPSSQGMVGAQALFAFLATDGAVQVFPTAVSDLAPVVKDGNLSFHVYSKEAELVAGVMTIYATLELPANRTTVSQVWQAGLDFSGGVPSGHPQSGDNLLSYGSIDFISGTTAGGGDGSRLRRRNTHGVLNAVSWGIMMPMGAITARYLKVFADPAWFYLHVACQFSAYVVAVAGVATGLRLGSQSHGFTHHSHRNIGITLLFLATLQVLALLLRPNKEHKYRIFWNVYHHSIGYLVLFLSIVNIFKGFDILMPSKQWKDAYAAIVAVLLIVALLLEVVTWIVVLRRRRRRRNNLDDKFHHGANGVHGYGGRQPYGA